MTTDLNTGNVRFKSEQKTYDVEKCKGNSVVFFSGGNAKIERVVERGYKVWLNLNNNFTVAVPVPYAEASWLQIVNAEKCLSRFFKEIGMFSFQVEEDNISTGDAWGLVYRFPTLESMSKEGKFVIDLRCEKNSTWRKQSHSFFDATIDYNTKLKPETWNAVFALFLEDIAKIIVYGLPLEPTSHNLAIIKTQTGFTVRYLGLDLISDPKLIPWNSRLHSINPLSWEKPLHDGLDTMIRAVLVCEFNRFALIGPEITLLNTLVKNYTSRVYEIGKKLHATKHPVKLPSDL